MVNPKSLFAVEFNEKYFEKSYPYVWTKKNLSLKTRQIQIRTNQLFTKQQIF